LREDGWPDPELLLADGSASPGLLYSGVMRLERFVKYGPRAPGDFEGWRVTDVFHVDADLENCSIPVECEPLPLCNRDFNREPCPLAGDQSCIGHVCGPSRGFGANFGRPSRTIADFRLALGHARESNAEAGNENGCDCGHDGRYDCRMLRHPMPETPKGAHQDDPLIGLGVVFGMFIAGGVLLWRAHAWVSK